MSLQHDSRLLTPRRASQRHYGMDWLRIAAFALLIVYHVAMVFAPWDWVIHSKDSYSALIVPMAMLTPWRLPLLFAVSGYASRKLYDRSGGPGPFAASRASRLLIPLAFGMAVIVPPEMWVRVLQNGYPASYLHFWTADYWRWGEFYGIEFPSWEHLWFVAYLATYSFALAGFLKLAGNHAGAWMERVADWLTHGPRLLWVPVAALIVMRLSLLFVVPERQGLTSDWAGHALYLPIFLFGFVLAGSSQLWPIIHRLWKPALAIGLATSLVAVTIEIMWPGSAIPPHGIMALDRASRVTTAWCVILALFHVAETWWNRDHPLRKPFAEAVFPFYIVHHPAIVVLAWYTLPLGLGPVTEFSLLLGGTTAICLAVYLVARRIGWLRPMIGLAPVPAPKHSAIARAVQGES